MIQLESLAKRKLCPLMSRYVVPGSFEPAVCQGSECMLWEPLLSDGFRYLRQKASITAARVSGVSITYHPALNQETLQIDTSLPNWASTPEGWADNALARVLDAPRGECGLGRREPG